MNRVDTNSKVSIVPLDEKWFQNAKVSPKAQEHLLSSLSNLRSGRDTTPTFPLYGSKDSKEIAVRFLDSLDWAAMGLPQGVKEYEYSRLEKHGGQGGFRPWSELEDLFYLYQERLAPCRVMSDAAFLTYVDQYKTIFCKMLAINESLAKLVAADKIQDRAAGCRDFNLKKTDPVAQRRAIQDYKSGLAENFFMYVFSRYNKLKPRIFMPGPFASMLDQARYIHPFLTAIQDDIKTKRSDSALVQHADKLGFEQCFDIMGEEISKAKLDFRQWSLLYVQGDFEKMDTTEGPSQYENLFIPAVAAAFNFGRNSENYKELSKSMMKTVKMPIASPSGMMVGDHGTGSGMNSTNIGEGCSNDYYELRWIELLKDKCAKENIQIKILSRRVNGDDSTVVIAVKSKNPAIIALVKKFIQECAEQAATECGFRINSKWRIDEHFGLFCQNYYWYDIRKKKLLWMYPASLIINAIMNPEGEYINPFKLKTVNGKKIKVLKPDVKRHPEKPWWDKDYRDIDVTEKLDNGKHLPYFTKLVDFVNNGMRYRLLGKSETETNRILSKYERYRALQPYDKYFNRVDYDFSKSPTINYLLKVRGQSRSWA